LDENDNIVGFIMKLKQIFIEWIRIFSQRRTDWSRD